MKSISFILAPRLLIPTRSMGEEREDGTSWMVEARAVVYRRLEGDVNACVASSSNSNCSDTYSRYIMMDYLKARATCDDWLETGAAMEHGASGGVAWLAFVGW